MDKNTSQFLEEYKQLVLKYGLSIDACGCCGSPYLVSKKEWENQEVRGKTKKSWEELLDEDIEHLRTS